MSGGQDAVGYGLVLGRSRHRPPICQVYRDEGHVNTLDSALQPALSGLSCSFVTPSVLGLSQQLLIQYTIKTMMEWWKDFI